MKHDPEKTRKPYGKGKVSRPSSSPRRNFLERGTPTGKSPSGKENQPTCFACKKGDCPKGDACDYVHPLERSIHQKMVCKPGEGGRGEVRGVKGRGKCALGHTEKAERANERNNTILWWPPEHRICPTQRIKSL